MKWKRNFRPARLGVVVKVEHDDNDDDGVVDDDASTAAGKALDRIRPSKQGGGTTLPNSIPRNSPSSIRQTDRQTDRQTIG